LRERMVGPARLLARLRFGRRVIDNLANGVARESKVDRTSLTRRMRSQIAKDVELMSTPGSGVIEAQWHFFPSSTGVGPTAPLTRISHHSGVAAAADAESFRERARSERRSAVATA
jgi:hypothetical protein